MFNVRSSFHSGECKVDFSVFMVACFPPVSGDTGIIIIALMMEVAHTSETSVDF
jgi:hypothetical protein